MYDIIGDIHGHADELEKLLEKLDYSWTDGCYRHSNRKVIFLGDFIDRGPNQRRVLQTVIPMVQQGYAKAVMGNHEYNALAFHTKSIKDTGCWLRTRTDKHIQQHIRFLDEFFSHKSELANVLEFFKTLPLWLDLDGVRIIHACWDEAYIKKILEFQNGSNLLGDDLLHASSDRSTWQYQAIEALLKGKEITLPKNISFSDKDGNERHEIRVRWWDNTAGTYQEAFMGPEHDRTHIPDDPISGDHLIEYGVNEKPVFLGHYWLEGQPRQLAKNICCVDYSVAKAGGKLVAYCWGEEKEIDPTNFKYVERL